MTLVDADIEQVCFEVPDFAAAARLMRRLERRAAGCAALRGASCIRRRRSLPVGAE